jgi:putative ABC transport system permease protein
MRDLRDEIRRRLAGARLDPTREAEVVDELAEHLRQRREELVAAGEREAAVERALLAELDGSELLARELARAAPRAPEGLVPGAAPASRLADLGRDVRFGLRSLRKSPGFTVVTLVSLALGVGANTALFHLLGSLHLRPLPVEDPHELALLKIENREWATGSFRSWHPDLTYALWRGLVERQEVFSELFAFGDTAFTVATEGKGKDAPGMFVSGDFFGVLGVTPAAGRLIGPADDARVPCQPVAVVSHGFWQRELGGDPAVVGRTLGLDGHRVEIIGVSRAGFFGFEVGRSFDVAVPLCSEPVLRAASTLLAKGHGWWLSAVGRLRPGVTLEAASAQLRAFSPALFAATVPGTYDAADQEHYRAYRLAASPAGTGISELRRDYTTPLYFLLGTAGLVLLIACANLANLLLARASAREREIAVRLALGASRRRLVRQLMVESLLLAAGGAALGLVLALWMSELVVVLLSRSNRVLFMDLSPDWRVVAFTGGMALVTCLLFGLAPALRASRTDVALVLKQGVRGAGLSRWGLRRVLVAAQVALSFVLLVGALLFTRSFQKLATVDVGFRPGGLLAVSATYTHAGLPEERWAAVERELVAAVEAIPGVTSAALAAIVPLSGNGWNEFAFVAGGDPDEEKIDAQVNRVGPGYFRTVGTPLLAGRDLDARDTLGAPPVAVVGETLARKMDVEVGARIRFDAAPGAPIREYTIVGVVGDSKYRTLREEQQPLVYLAAAQEPEPRPTAQLLVRSDLPRAELERAVERAALRVVPSAVIETAPVDLTIRETLRRDRLMAMLSGFFGFLAALLATLGLYGVVSYGVARRTRELGIRVALGAGRRRITRLVVGESLALLVAGLIAGLGLAVVLMRLARSLLYELSPTDPATLAAAVALMAVVTLLASVRPARRAAKVDPMVALREE